MTRSSARTVFHKDCHGKYISQGDKVIVVSYDGNGPRLSDCGIATIVTRLTPTRVEIFDADNARRLVNPRCLRVVTDGE